MSDDDALTAEYDKGVLVLYLVGALLFVALGFALWDGPRPGSRLVAVAAIGFFGLCALIAFRRLLWFGTVLTIDAQGVFDRRITDRVVPWSAIAATDVASIQNQPFCVVTLTRPASEFVSNPLKRLMLMLNAPFTGGGIYLSGAGLDVTSEDIDGELRRRLKILRAPA